MIVNTVATLNTDSERNLCSIELQCFIIVQHKQSHALINESEVLLQVFTGEQQTHVLLFPVVTRASISAYWFC